MGDVKENEMKVLPSLDYIRGLLGNDSGKMLWANFVSSLLSSRIRLNIIERGPNGENMLQSKVGIVFAYDSTNIDKYLLYAYVRNDGGTANRIVIAANSLLLGDQNNHGTSVVSGADTQICIYISK